MISYEKALSCTLHHAPKRTTHRVPLLQSCGALLKENIYASRPIPPFDRVAMDGIAVGSLKPRRFFLKGEQYAGEPPLTLHHQEECIEVMTGSILPHGAQAVIPIEHLEKNGECFTLKPATKVSSLQHIHHRGSDAKKGQLLLEANTYITAAHISLIASLGRKTIRVAKPYRLSVISTGDELCPPDKRPKSYQIFSSNGEALVSVLGNSAQRFHAKDTLSDILQSLEDSLKFADIVVISGGVSLGKKDLVPLALQQAGVECLIHGVWQKPGKPFYLGKTKQGQLLFGLPGNPVAMLISLYLYLLPLLRPMPKSFAVLQQDVKKKDSPYAHFALAKMHQGEVQPLVSNGSGDLVALAQSDGFIRISKGKKGELVPLWLW